MGLSTRNFPYLSKHYFYTSCANQNFVPTIGWPSGWRHVWAIPIRNKGLQESLSLDPVSYVQTIFCMEWRIIDGTTELLPQIFKILRKKTDKLKKYILKTDSGINEIYSYRTHQDQPVLNKFSLTYKTNDCLMRHLFLLFTSQRYHRIVLIVQMHIWACSRRRITK